jgi:hypothetical protein
LISDNLAEVLRRITVVSRHSGRADTPRLVGVTKNRTVPEISELIRAGLLHLAENRWDEWSSKTMNLKDEGEEPLHWHFIGGLQGRSLRRFYRPLFRIDSLDSLEHAKLLSDLSERAGTVQEVLLEINVANSEGRRGIRPERMDDFLDRVSPLEGLKVQGLMVMGPIPDPDRGLGESRRVFESAREIWLGARSRWPFLLELSMGMSEDFEEAIRAGCTEVRIGRLLFERGNG